MTGADIKKNDATASYSIFLALVSRLNKDNTLVANKDFSLKEEGENGIVTEKTVTGGIQGFLGTKNISTINGATGVNVIFVEGDKSDTVNIDLSTVTSPTAATVDNIVTALNLDISDVANFPNIGHGFTASKDSSNRLRIKASGEDVETTFGFAILDDDDDLATAKVATVLELNRSYIRPMLEPKSKASSPSTTDSTEKQATSGKGAVVTVRTAQQTTGYEITLEDSARSPYTKVAICGGHFDPETSIETPKKNGVSSPLFGLMTFSPLFDKGSYNQEGFTKVLVTIYPSCTGVIASDDNTEEDFDPNSYDIVASDGADIPAGTKMYITKDQYNKYLAFANTLTA